jgi:tetratricopeptide (TPR) repeat protein
MHRSRVVPLLVAASLLAAAPVRAEPAAPAGPAAEPPAGPSAAELSTEAIARFEAKDYDAAARLFEQAHGLDPNPNYLFNIGRVYEEKGDIRRAVEYYERFLQQPGVTIESRDLALQRLRVLKAILRETGPQPGAPAEAQPAPAPAPEPAPPQARPVADDPDPKKTMRLAGYGLLGIGGVSMIVGGIFGGMTLARKSELDDAPAEDRPSIAHQGTTFAAVSDVTLFSGAALAVTGLVLVLVARPKRAPTRAALAPSLGRTHAGLVWSLRF